MLEFGLPHVVVAAVVLVFWVAHSVLSKWPVIGIFDLFSRSDVTKLKARKRTDRLIILLGSREDHLRGEAAQALGALRCTAATESLLTAMVRDDNRYVRDDIVHALGQIGDARAIKPLISLLAAVAISPTDNSPCSASSVVDALARFPQAVDPLIFLASEGLTSLTSAKGTDESLSTVQRFALWALTKSEDPRATDFVFRKVFGPPPGPFAIHSRLERVLGRDPSNRAEIIWQLGEAKKKSAVPELIAILRNRREGKEVRNAAVVALGSIRDRAAVPALVEELEAGTIDTKDTVGALRTLGDQRAAPILAKMLTSYVGDMQRTVLYTLQAIEKIDGLGNTDLKEPIRWLVRDINRASEMVWYNWSQKPGQSWNWWDPMGLLRDMMQVEGSVIANTARQALTEALTDADRYIRACAASVLGEMHPSSRRILAEVKQEIASDSRLHAEYVESQSLNLWR